MIKKFLKSIPAVHQAGRFAKARLIDLEAIPRFLEERSVKHADGPIRVGFLCQYIPAWTKMESVYRAMKSDSRFEPCIVCLPLGISNRHLDDPASLVNEAYEYCVTNGFPEAINALVDKNQFIDVKVLDLHYLFYPRPYNAMMPIGYGTKEVSRFCRVCLIMYGVEFAEEMTAVSLNRDFFSAVYYYFAEMPMMQRKNTQNNLLGHALGLQKTQCHGYPMFEHLLSFRDCKSPSWDFHDGGFRVMWTPRWITDPKQGGSNFFLYYREFLKFARENPDMSFLFRPHPLAFVHFVETGEMTQQQVDDYKAECDGLPNVCIDKAPNYEATLWNTDVLVSDISSIMPEYFITGNPLIFCASNMGLELTKDFQRMLEGCYVVNNQQELFQCLRKLRSGEDPLRQLRQQIIQEQFGSSFSGACENILNALAQDRK